MTSASWTSDPSALSSREAPVDFTAPVSPIDSSIASAQVKYQWVMGLTPATAAEFEALTFPSLQRHWQQHPCRGVLLGVAAAVAGELVGLAIAEFLPTQQTATLLSLLVKPEQRQRGLGKPMLRFAQRYLAPYANLQTEVRTVSKRLMTA